MSLRNSARNGNVNAVRKLLNNGVNINEADQYGETPLHYASQEGHTEVVKVLLATAGIKVNKSDQWGQTPLGTASREGHAEAVKVLLDAPGIKVNKADNNGRTPLHRASYKGNTEVVKALVAAPGIKVNQGDKDGWTPLIEASRDGRTEVVKLLLAAGADPFKAPFFSALDIATSAAVKKLLMEAMGITLPWRNMDANQRRIFKPILLRRMIAKNASNKNFKDPISQINYSLKTLKPVSKGEKNLGRLGMVINGKNKPIRLVNTTQLRNAQRYSRSQTVRGIFHPELNWSLINVTPEEYSKERKKMEKLSAIAKSARTRKNLKTGRTKRIEANQRKTARIAGLHRTMRNLQKELNTLI